MQFLHAHLKKSAHRLMLWVCLFCAIIFFTGCGDLFDSNPILSNMESGQGELDLSLENLAGLEGSEGEENATNSSTEATDDSARKAFNKNYDMLKELVTVQYVRTLKYVDAPPEKTTEAQKFLLADSLAVSEYGPSALLINPSDGNKLFVDQSGEAKLFSIGSDGFPLDIDSSDTRSLIYYLTHNIDVVCTGTEEEELNDKIYTAYVVTENGQPAKWYFDDNGYLAIRLFRDDNVVCAVYYNNLKVNVDLDSAFFEVTEDLESLRNPTANTSSDAQEEDSSLAESSSPAESSTTTSGTTAKTPTGSTPAPSTTVSPPVSSQTSSKTSSTTTSSATSSATTSSPSSSSPAVSSSSSQPSASGPSPIPDYTTSSAPVSKPPEQKTIDPKTLSNYPYEYFPIIYGYNISSYQDNTVGGRRIIEIRGTLVGPVEAAAEYYEDVLSGSPTYKSKFLYDENSNASYYLLSGRLHGWDANYEITEDHFSFERTMTVRLEG